MAASRFLQLKSTLNEDIVAFADRLTTTLAGIGNITVNAFDLKSFGNGTFQATITYVPGGSVIEAAGFFASDDSSNPEGSVDDANAFFTANPTYTGLYVRSLNIQDTQKIPVKSVLVLYDTQPGGGSAHPYNRRIKFFRSQGAVTSGNTGAVDLLNTSGGAYTTQTVRNRTSVAWVAGTEGVAYFDEVAGEYVGYGSCC